MIDHPEMTTAEKTSVYTQTKPTVIQAFARSDGSFVTLHGPLNQVDIKPTDQQVASLLVSMLRARPGGHVACNGCADMRAIERVWASGWPQEPIAGDSSHDLPSTLPGTP